MSDAVQAEIQGLGITVDRRFGPTRFDTAADLANFARDTLGFSTDDLILATGSNFPDAVAAGPLGGVQEAPIVLTADPLPAPSALVCEQNRPTVDELFVMGTTTVVSDPVVETCKGLVEGPPVGHRELRRLRLGRPARRRELHPQPHVPGELRGWEQHHHPLGHRRLPVKFPGLGVNEGTVSVTSYGTTGNECHVQSWGASAGDLLVEHPVLQPRRCGC